MKEIEYLSKHLSGRSAGSAKEQEAATYLMGRLEDFGYIPHSQGFSFDYQGETFTSANIIAEREGSSGKQILIGAHYDTAPSETREHSTLEGTNDNASGVGVLLELAQRLDLETTHTVKFILFGAEEVGFVGSRYYVSSMSEEAIRNTLVMVNLDGLIVGDQMYFHAGKRAASEHAFGYYRDLALQISAEFGIVAETNPGLNPDYPAGTGCCSDLEAFENLIPVLAAEATNWSIGDLDGYTQTSHPDVPGGQTWHDPTTDNVAFIHATFPGLIAQRSANYMQILDTFVDRVNAGAVAPI
ncbi:MAG: M20/M25/M40 family metallo-hydrolase [Cyanobacteria bacterium P01_F01_bin.116]